MARPSRDVDNMPDGFHQPQQRWARVDATGECHRAYAVARSQCRISAETSIAFATLRHGGDHGLRCRVHAAPRVPRDSSGGRSSGVARYAVASTTGSGGGERGRSVYCGYMTFASRTRLISQGADRWQLLAQVVEYRQMSVRGWLATSLLRSSEDRHLPAVTPRLGIADSFIASSRLLPPLNGLSPIYRYWRAEFRVHDAE